LGRGKQPIPNMGSFVHERGNIGGMPVMRTASNDSLRINSRTPSDGQFKPRPNQLSRPPSQRGSQRGGKKGGQGRIDHMHQQQMMTPPLPDVAPVEKTENAWAPSISIRQSGQA